MPPLPGHGRRQAPMPWHSLGAVAEPVGLPGERAPGAGMTDTTELGELTYP